MNEKFAHYFLLYTSAPWCGGLLAGLLHRGHVHAYSTINKKGANRMSKLIGDQPVKQIAGGMAAAEEAMRRDQAEKAEKA